VSPAATQTISEAETDILVAANQLFYDRGVSAVTVADIRDLSRVSLRRLYSLYPSKSDLITGLLQHRHTTWMDQYAKDVNELMSIGAYPVDALFESLEAWLVSTHFRGCGFINTLAETGELTAVHRAIIQDHKQGLIDFLNSLSGLSGRGPALAVLIDGAIVQAAVFQSIEPVAAARVVADSLM